MPTLSVAVITLNEEDRIREALESVRFADEIVVVDSGSADRTVEICREFTDKVFIEAWRGFAGQKNAAVERTAGDWVLSIDADEQVTAELADEIREVVSSGGQGDGYLVPRRNFFGGTWVRHGGWYPDYTLRLFRRGKGQFAERRVHEAVTLNGGRVGRLRSPLIHRTYEGVSDYLRRMDRYSTLAADELRARGHRARWFDLVLRPPAVFLRNYVLRAGFLDGRTGLIAAGLTSAYTFSKYAKLAEMGRAEQRSLPLDA